MSENMPDYSELYDAKGNLLGVYLNAAVWTQARERLMPIIEDALYALGSDALSEAPEKPEPPEPLNDLNLLIEYWDFSYPFAYDVACECCGAETQDWRADEPRKFRLKAANMGGLVNFQCQTCKARVIKRHFKKHVSSECRPYIAE